MRSNQKKMNIKRRILPEENIENKDSSPSILVSSIQSASENDLKKSKPDSLIIANPSMPSNKQAELQPEDNVGQKRKKSSKPLPPPRIQPGRKAKPQPQKNINNKKKPTRLTRDALLSLRTRPISSNTKYSMRLSDSFANLNTPTKKIIKESISEKNKKIPNHTKIGKIIKYTPGGKHPQIAYTPEEKNILYLGAKWKGLACFYSTNAKAQCSPEPIEELAPKNLSSLLESVAGQSIKEPDSSIQEMKTKVNIALLEESHKAFVANLFRRKTSQPKVVAVKGKQKNASATQYMRASKVFDRENINEESEVFERKNISEEYVKANWTHLIAHSVLNEKAQIPENLCAATAHANTNMMFIEGHYKFIADAYPEGYTLKVKTEMIPRTKIAIRIYMTIETPDFTLEIETNAQEVNKPDKIIDIYTSNIITSLIYHVKQNNSVSVLSKNQEEEALSAIPPPAKQLKQSKHSPKLFKPANDKVILPVEKMKQVKAKI